MRTQLLNNNNELVGYYDPNNNNQILDKYGSIMGRFDESNHCILNPSGIMVATYSGDSVKAAAKALLYTDVHFGCTV